MTEAKYKIGDKVFMVRGLSFIGLEVTRVVYLVGADATEIQYEGNNASSGKAQPTREDELVATIEEAKVLLHKENQIQSDAITKTINEAQDPFTVKKTDDTKKA